MAEKYRCRWANLKNPLYVSYHDEQWGVPVYDDNVLFEMILLESFQAGLSWECVLNKREAFRIAFDNFDTKKIAHYSDAKVLELLGNANIIRNKLKILASISNAKAFMKIQEEVGSFKNYIWQWTDNKIIMGTGEVIPRNELSDKIAKDLKKRGFKFFGSTTVYAYLQAIGIINDHELECFCRG